MSVEGMDADFLNRVNALIREGAKAGVQIRIGNGFRTRAQQAALYKQKPHLAAPPGRSNHEKGLAADLVYGPGAQSWAIENAGRFGLRFPMLGGKGKKNEPWHIEPARGAKTTPHGGYQSANAAEHSHEAPEAHMAEVDEAAQRKTVEYQMQSFAQILMGGVSDGVPSGSPQG